MSNTSPDPTQLDVGRHRLIGLETVTHPIPDSTRSTSQRPWLGVVVKLLAGAGIATPGRLRAAGPHGKLDFIVGVGFSARRELLQYLGLAAHLEVSGSASAQTPANSVFNLYH